MLRARLTLKLPVLVVGAVLLTAATVAVLAISIGRGILRQAALEELVERREVYASAVDFYIGGARGLIGVTADRPAMKEFARHWLTPSAAPVDPAAIEGFRRALAATVLQHADAFEYLMLLKPDGTVYVLEPRRLERELSHRNLAFAAWYKDALAAPDTVVSDLHISPATQRPTVVVAAPVRGTDGVIIGVWAGGLQLARLSKLGSVGSGSGASRARTATSRTGTDSSWRIRATRPTWSIRPTSARCRPSSARSAGEPARGTSPTPSTERSSSAPTVRSRILGGPSCTPSRSPSPSRPSTS